MTMRNDSKLLGLLLIFAAAALWNQNPPLAIGMAILGFIILFSR